MASLIMHIAVTKLIKEKYNLSDKFMAGSIMPDIYAKCNLDRDQTHYIDKIDNLPNYKKYLQINSNNLNDEIVLGYTAHLIEDYIWFSKFKNKYVRKIDINPKKVEYLKDRSIHQEDEFWTDLYYDYNYMDNYLCEKYDISVEEIKPKISKYFTNSDAKEKLNENLYLRNFDSNRENKFITHQELDKYIELSKNKVEEALQICFLEN